MLTSKKPHPTPYIAERHTAMALRGGMSCDNPKIDYVIPLTDITAKTSRWQFLPYPSDSVARPAPDRQSWFAFSGLLLDTQDEFANLNGLRVYMRLANRIIRVYRFRCISTFLAKMRLQEEPWFVLSGSHPPAETSPVFAFGFVKTSGGFAVLA